MKELKKIDVVSAAKVSGVIYFVIGAISALLTLLLRDLLGASTAMTGMMVGTPQALILLPIVYAISGVILGALIAFVYNIIAEKIGGIKLDI